MDLKLEDLMNAKNEDFNKDLKQLKNGDIANIILNKHINRIDWDIYFLLLAKIASLRSSCNSRKVGAIIVKNRRIISTGYVGSVIGTFQCSDINKNYCHRRALKIDDSDKYNFCLSVHAEANAISQAARYGTSIEGGSIYCTLQPCFVCLKLIANSGVKSIYYEKQYDSKNTERDKYWLDKIEEFGIKSVQLEIPNYIIDNCVASLYEKTSVRKKEATE